MLTRYSICIISIYYSYTRIEKDFDFVVDRAAFPSPVKSINYSLYIRTTVEYVCRRFYTPLLHNIIYVLHEQFLHLLANVIIFVRSFTCSFRICTQYILFCIYDCPRHVQCSQVRYLYNSASYINLNESPELLRIM